MEQKLGKTPVKPPPTTVSETPAGGGAAHPPATGTTPVKDTPAVPEPVVVAPPPAVAPPPPAPTPPVSRMSTEEASALETRLIGVMAKAENAETSVAHLQTDLQRKGLSIHPSTIDALSNMRTAVARAKRQFAAGDVNGVNDSLAAAEVFAGRALKAVGR